MHLGKTGRVGPVSELYNPAFLKIGVCIFGKNWLGELLHSLSGEPVETQETASEMCCRRSHRGTKVPRLGGAVREGALHGDSADTGRPSAVHTGRGRKPALVDLCGQVPSPATVTPPERYDKGLATVATPHFLLPRET